MEIGIILIGIGFILLFASVILVELFVWKEIKNYKEPIKEEPIIVEKPIEAKLTDGDKKKQEELRKNFENLMGYGYEDALKKKE